MKQKRLAPILALALSFEMMVSPIVAHAQVSSAPGIAIGIMNIASGLVNNSQANYNPRLATDMGKLNQQIAELPDKYFNTRLMQMPGLAQYLALNNINPARLNCSTLATTMYEAQPESCYSGMSTSIAKSPLQQQSEMNSYRDAYLQVSKRYKNFTAESNVGGQLFGVGCMKDAMNVLNGFFKYRLDELDKLVKLVDGVQDEFMAKSRADLDAIEEAVAVLDGESEIADKVRSSKPDLFDFGKRFNNPACGSMFMGEALNDKGRAGGLNAINREIKNLLTDKQGKYSGESYAQSHAGVVEDISSVVDKISKQVELNFATQGNDPKAYGEFLKSIPSLVTSTSGVQDSIRLDMFANVQGKYTEQFAKLNAEKALIQSELPASATALSNMGSLNAATFEAEINSLEIGIKNSCLTNNMGDKNKLFSKIYDPTSSKHANKNASNFMKDKLNQILNNENTSIEKKLADIQALETQQGNRYAIRMENSYEVQDVDANGNLTTKVVGASSNPSPGAYIADLIKNCNAQFKANKLNNKLTGAAAIQRLRTLGQSFKTFAKTQAADVKQELRKKLIECSSPEIANNTVGGSCTPALFNTSSPGFCANAALSCSKNMQACSKQAEGYVKEIRDQKTARVANYKTKTAANKASVIDIFEKALSKYMQEGDMLRGMFGAGFSAPAGIKREIFPESERYLTSFASATGKQGSPDGKLLLEDPAKYKEMFKENIASLKKEVQKQQDQLLGGDSVDSGKEGLFASHIKNTEKNYKDVIKEADKSFAKCDSSLKNATAEMDRAAKKNDDDMFKRNMEMGEKRMEWCDKYSMAGDNPIGACSGSVKDTMDALKAAQTAEAKQAINKFSNFCRSYNNSNTATNGTSNIEFEDICIAAGSSEASPATLKGPLVAEIASLCRQAESQTCVEESTTVGNKTTTAKSAGCGIIEKNTKKVTNFYRQTVNLNTNPNPISLQEIDAGAVCGAPDNSNRSAPKDIEGILNEVAKQQRARAN
jgi:hypothetical protein